MAGAVDECGLVKLARDSHEELAQQENEEGVAEKGGYDERTVTKENARCSNHVEVLENDVHRNQRDGIRQQHSTEHDQEDKAPAAPVDTGKGVGRERAGDEGAYHIETGNDHRIAGVAREVAGQECTSGVAKREGVAVV